MAVRDPLGETAAVGSPGRRQEEVQAGRSHGVAPVDGRNIVMGARRLHKMNSPVGRQWASEFSPLVEGLVTRQNFTGQIPTLLMVTVGVRLDSNPQKPRQGVRH